MNTINLNTQNTNIKPINSTPQKKKLTDMFSENLKNSADMNDCITVPRTIFKGYLGIMFGTTLTTVANLFSKNQIAKKGLTPSGIALATYGTWAFARPYVTKGAVPTTALKK